LLWGLPETNWWCHQTSKQTQSHAHWMRYMWQSFPENVPIHVHSHGSRTQSPTLNTSTTTNPNKQSELPKAAPKSPALPHQIRCHLRTPLWGYPQKSLTSH
jgi:hypothetical protein